MKEKINIFLFTYGSLMSEMRLNHLLLEKGAIFCGQGKTIETFEFYDLGKYPGIVKNISGKQIIGEVWAINNSTLELLDLIEGIPTLFKRNIAKITVESKTINCFYYELASEAKKESSRKLEVNSWREVWTKIVNEREES